MKGGVAPAGTIRSVLFLQPRPGGADAVVDFYRRYRVLEQACEQEGCLGCELQLPTGGPETVLVTALWRDADAYQGWLDNPARGAQADELSALLVGFEESARGDLYEVVLAVPPPQPDRDGGR